MAQSFHLSNIYLLPGFVLVLSRGLRAQLQKKILTLGVLRSSKERQVINK